MAWTPIKLKPDPKARGWKPKAGWYCYNTVQLRADLGTRYATKKQAETACKRGRGLSGRRELTIPEQHQLRIAKRTLKMPDQMVAVMGGMTKKEAAAIVKKLG